MPQMSPMNWMMISSTMMMAVKASYPIMHNTSKVKYSKKTSLKKTMPWKW